jgi:c-di-GMP-binding flagellar brake protein YcgR
LSITKSPRAKSGTEVSEKLDLPLLSGKNPFPIRSSQGRKYVRIEIASPIDFHLLLPKRGRISLSKNKSSGKVLNLSCGGILLQSDEVLPEEAFLLLSLNLNGLVVLEGVLGKIKRVEPTEDGEYLVGVEFCSKEELENFVPKEQIQKLPVRVASFNHKLKEIISGHLRTAQLVAQSTKTGF